MENMDTGIKKKILFVDDEPRLLDGLERMLRPMRNSWCMAFAASGQAALELMKSAPFDVVVSDIRMPVMNGLEVLETIKKNNIYTHIPVLIVSTESEDDKMSRAFAAGAKGYISKPFTPERLLNLIRGRISA